MLFPNEERTETIFCKVLHNRLSLSLGHPVRSLQSAVP